jgi:uncharacterized membrane protein
MFIDSNQKNYLKYVKKIIIKSCSSLKLLKIVDMMNRHSCFLMNFQNIDYQSFDLLEKFVDFVSYFVISFHISIKLSRVSCSKICVLHDAIIATTFFRFWLTYQFIFLHFFLCRDFDFSCLVEKEMLIRMNLILNFSYEFWSIFRSWT